LLLKKRIVLFECFKKVDSSADGFINGLVFCVLEIFWLKILVFVFLLE